MLKIITSLFLVSAVLLSSALPMMAQTKGLKKIQVSAGDNGMRPSLKEMFAVERSKINAEKPFTEEDVKRFQKKSLNTQVKKNNFSTSAKIGIGLGIAAAVIVIAVLATRKNDDSGPIQCGIRAPCP